MGRAPRWIMYWVGVIDAHLGPGRATIRTDPLVAGKRPHRPGNPDHISSARGAGEPGIKWFLTDVEFEKWKDGLPVRYQINADMYAHVGHYPWEHQPWRCTACGLRQKMTEALS